MKRSASPSAVAHSALERWWYLRRQPAGGLIDVGFRGFKTPRQSFQAGEATKRSILEAGHASDYGVARCCSSRSRTTRVADVIVCWDAPASLAMSYNSTANRHCRLACASFISYSSVMTEMTVRKGQLAPPVERFVLHWGEMGNTWGVNRSIAQIHALLFVSAEPLTAEEIAAQLVMARSNVSTSIRELLVWKLIRRVHVRGDRRDHYEAEADLFEMVRRIAYGRKQREIDPTIEMLRNCVGEARSDKRVSAHAQARLASMLEFMNTVDKGFDEIMRLPAPTLMRLIKMGGALAKFVGRGRS